MPIKDGAPSDDAKQQEMSVPNQERIKENLLSLLENHDDDYLNELRIEPEEAQPMSVEKEKDVNEEDAVEAQGPPLVPIVIASPAKKTLHNRRAIEDDEGEEEVIMS